MLFLCEKGSFFVFWGQNTFFCAGKNENCHPAAPSAGAQGAQAFSIRRIQNKLPQVLRKKALSCAYLRIFYPKSSKKCMFCAFD